MSSGESWRCADRAARVMLVAVLSVVAWGQSAARAQGPVPSVEVAVALPLSGDEAVYGERTLQGIQIAIEEANAEGTGPRINLVTYDDRGNDDAAKEVAGKIVASPAMLVLGPSFSTASLAAGPVYAAGGVVSLAPTATADTITRNATTFRVIFKNSEQGETLAFYVARVLDKKRAAVIVVDNGYGRSLQGGFEEAAKRLGIDAQYFVFKTADEARANFADLFGREPEERATHGFFSDGVYATSPAILDSANAETLAFAERYRARFGRDPSWEAVQGYDAGRLAVAVVRAAVAAGPAAPPEVQAGRNSVQAQLASLDSPGHAVAGLTGPLWFNGGRVRTQPVRMGRFHGPLLESAPLQLVPAPNPDAAEIGSGTVVDTGNGHFARRQQVVYTGLFLNEIGRVDVAQSKFAVDLYLWTRFAHDAGTGAADPSDIIFPDLVRGSSDGKKLIGQGDLDDGTTYRLWRLRGEFKNDFDLHHYPVDRQSLAVRFYNAHAASDHLVYVQDRRVGDSRSRPSAVVAASGAGSGAALAGEPTKSVAAQGPLDRALVAADAFRSLTQWQALHATERRDSLVTESALGDPRLVGVERVRELSGFILTIDLYRRVFATLVKTLFPLGLMMLILYASLFFPSALVKEKIGVAVTGALSGTVLLAAINSQLGGVGYVIAVEYLFYAFFTLCLFCVVLVLAAERLRAAGRPPTAVLVEVSGRYVFAFAAAATVLGAWLIASHW